MKLFFLIIILSLIDSILNSDYEFNLTSRSELYLGYLDDSKSYKFYIPALYRHNLYIEFRKQDSASTDHQYLYIYEYSQRNSTLPIGWTDSNHLHYSRSTNSYSLLYMVNYPGCKYLAFEIRPIYSMVNTYVEAIYVNEYDLTFGSPLYLKELSFPYFHIFYVPVKYPQTVNIELNKSDSLFSSSQSIFITEQSNRASSSKIKTDGYNLIYIASKNSYIISYEIVYHTCKYLALEILPDYQMSNAYFKVTNNPKIYKYDLNVILEKYLSTVYESYIYKFYIPAEKNDEVEFELISYISTVKLNTLYFYEYSNKDSTSELSKTRINNSSINTYSYTVSDSSCNYVALEIKPNKEISGLLVKVNVKKPISRTVNLTIVIIVSIIVIIVIICIISLLVWYFKRKNRKNEISIAEPLAQPLSPLYQTPNNY